VILRLWLFHLVCFSWILFRANDIKQFWHFVGGLFKAPVLEIGSAARLGLVLPVVIVDYLIFTRNDQVALSHTPWWVRGIAYFLMFWFIISMGRWGGEGFIYFQF
jgi:hypothetical protein